MKLLIYINSGERKGTKICLGQISKIDNLEYVLEDEDVTFEFTLPNESLEQGYQHVKLYLHEVDFDATEIQTTTEGKRFRWFSQSKYVKKELFFRNYCGIAELSINISGYDIEEKMITFSHIDILASKLSANRVTAMLDFLSSNDAKDIAALARITKRESGLQQDKELITSLVDKLSSYLIIIRQIIPKIIYKPITKVQPKSKVLPFNQDLYLNHDSIKWLSMNLDELMPCSKYDNYDVVLDKKFYKINKILVNYFIENTDIYENQVVHGFIKILLMKIDSILMEYNSKYTENSKSLNINGYFSLFTKISKFQFEINKNLLQKLKNFKSELLKIDKLISKKIPVSKALINTPFFTLKVKNNDNYKLIFKKMIELKKLGSPDWSLQEELNSIRDIPKLFEYYCLLLTKRSLDNILNNYIPSSIQGSFTEKINDNYLSYTNTESSIDLYYEPKIWSDKNIDSIIPSLINSEAWIIDKNQILPRKNTYVGTKSRNRCPDIVIRLKNSNSEKYIIIDAKYTNSFLSWKTYLPELAMKYIHGIHNKSGSNSTLALIILNPDEKGFTRHYLDHDFTIYGENTVYPSLFNSILDVMQSNEIETNYSEDLKRLITPFLNNPPLNKNY
ncbi:hypothetical protein KTI96_10070 [Acinetobacter bereziniae]|uniref:hypothetical protein n=2 Tax=Acinetobacter bereziniae TaxID=106648 RepID=UPI0018FF364D|nr:hypothetical protein [Acinetobacter bereziniae]MBJ8423640.1 hypothetical protein [Acinetobacter bereziniae]MCU4537511.1 hypothetical protein [Acinetobacter bereziniae]